MGIVYFFCKYFFDPGMMDASKGVRIMELGELLEQLRTEHDYTQDYVASRIHVEQPTVSNYESGKAMPSYAVLIELANLYDVSIDYLLQRTNIRASFAKLAQGIRLTNGKKLPIDTMMRLTDRDKERLIDYVELLLGQQEYLARFKKN